MKDFWNGRYSEQEYAYGEEPNIFFAEQLKALKPGIIILPCDGEGRNAVFAANNGWHVTAFDSSEEGKSKAFQLADKLSVKFEYIIEDAMTISYPDNSADVVAPYICPFAPGCPPMFASKSNKMVKTRRSYNHGGL